MTLDHDICYRALETRDRRFDGRFFTGVTSTGIYCRPICPARTPRADHCKFFACAAAAEEAGFRACRRCRPETSPGTPAWCGTSSTVSRALRLIADGALDEAGVEALAGRLGLGARHLRRLFVDHLGASPLMVAHTRRAHLAKRLLLETDLPMVRIALASGFHNVRRFNAAMRKSFAASPREIRAAANTGAATRSREGLVLKLAYREPYDWERLLAYLRPRLIPGVERIVDDRYLRTVELDGIVGGISVARGSRGRSELCLRVPAVFTSRLSEIVNRVRSQFDLDADPAAIAEHLKGDPRLARLLRRDAGVRVPGTWDRFELSVRAVLGQQITVQGATRLAGRLVERFGREVEASAADTDLPHRLFPRPEELATADIETIGMPAARAETLRGLARAVSREGDVLKVAAGLEESLDALKALPGIGDWTAQYVAMRALNEPDAFPAGDLGLRRAMASEGVRPSSRDLLRAAEPWRPWRAYAAMLLWRADESENP